MDKIREHIEEAKNEEFKLLEKRKITCNNDLQNFNFVFIVLIMIFILVLIIVYFIIISNLNAFRKSEKVTADKNWTLTGSGNLAQDIQGNLLIQEVGQSIINHFVTYLNGNIGAMYIANDAEPTLHLTNGYALSRIKKDMATIRFGDGIIGQVAEEKKLIVLEKIPSENFPINSGMGEIFSSHTLVAPILYEDRTDGVVEL